MAKRPLSEQAAFVLRYLSDGASMYFVLVDQLTKKVEHTSVSRAKSCINNLVNNGLLWRSSNCSDTDFETVAITEEGRQRLATSHA